jgi:hypothetical protein
MWPQKTNEAAVGGLSFPAKYLSYVLPQITQIHADEDKETCKKSAQSAQSAGCQIIVGDNSR